MENKRKININRPKITKEEIKKHQSFDGVMTSFQKMTKPFYKRPRFFRGLILGIVIASLVFYEVTRERENGEATQMPFVNPPLKELNVAHKEFKIDADKGGDLSYETGSKIHIPEQAFVDAKGNPIEGEVEIKYREFHNPAEVILSGIPMHYDSAGTQYHFESAGMLEILAYKDNEPVYLKSGKQIQMEMASFRTGSQYNLYQLDTNQRNWVYKGKDQIMEIEKIMDEVREVGQCDTVAAKKVIAALEKEREQLMREIKNVEEKMPVEPKMANTSRYRFNIDFEKEEFPELDVYKGLYFEIGEENKNFNPNLASVTWEDMLLEQGEIGQNYKLTLTKGAESHTFVVYPVFEGKDYEKAKAEYDRKFEEYNKTLTSRKEEEKRKQEEFVQLQKKLEAERIARKEQWERERKAQDEEYERMKVEWEAKRVEMEKQWAEEKRKREEAMANSQKVYRAFAINSLGAWNCDNPRNLPKGAQIAAQFSNQKGEEIIFSQVMLVDLKRNAYFTYYSHYFGKFQFDPKAENILVGITPHYKIAIFTKDEFSKIGVTRGAYNFRMNVIEENFKSVDEVRELLNLPGMGNQGVI